MKQETRRRSTELNELKSSRKYKTQWKKKLEEKVQNSMKQKTGRRNTKLNEIKNWKKKHRTQPNKKLEEETQNSMK